MKTKTEISQLLDRVGGEVDSLGDQLMLRMIEEGRTGEIHALFPGLTANQTALPASAPPPVFEYFQETARLPTWADMQLIDRGERTFCDYGPECLVLLLFKSLPQGYSMWHVAKTLYITGQLTEHNGNLKALTKRILETLQFLVNVMGPDGFSPPRRARVTTQKIRLIHATIRNKIVEVSAWQNEWKPPINQEEILMTMLTFSLVITDGLRQLGIRLAREEEEGVLHLWKVVAHVLGMKEELQPKDLDEARTMWTVIVERNRTLETDEGVKLAESAKLYGQSILPDELGFLPELFLYYLNDKEVRHLLKLKRPSMLLLAVLVPLRALLFGTQLVENLSPVARWLLRRLHLMVIKGLISQWNEHRPVTFTLPGSLQGAWNLRAFCADHGIEDDRQQRPG